MKKFFSKKHLVFCFAVIVVPVVAYFLIIDKNKPAADFAIVKRGALAQMVSVTGRVEPVRSVDLAFETSGRIASIAVEVGDRVAAGETLVSLENSSVMAQLNLAQAGLRAQEITLAELKNGSRPEEIAVYQAKQDAAENALSEARKGLVDKIKDAYTKADDSVRSKTDKFFNNPRTDNPQIIFFVIDSQLENETEQLRQAIEATLIVWNNSLLTISTSSDLSAYLSQAKNNLDQIRSFMEKLSTVINGLTPTYSLSQITIDSYKTDVSSARTSINTAVANLVATEENWNASQMSLLVAKKELLYRSSPATPEQIAGQEALIDQAKAEVATAQSQLGKTVIVSPIAGVVVRQDAKRGEIVAVGSVLVSIISAARFEVEVNIPEADIVKITLGNNANITLDAFGQNQIFMAKVVQINPGETMVEGVATYKTKLQFVEETNLIKPGMTANIDIITARVEDALLIPQRCVISKNGDKSVMVLGEGGETAEVAIKTGLKDASGNIEVIEGLKEGDKIILSPKEK